MDTAAIILVTRGNLDLVADKGIRFISRLPATFGQEHEVKDRAFADGGRVDVCVSTQNPRPDSARNKCKDYEELEEQLRKLERTEFECEPDAMAALARAIIQRRVRRYEQANNEEFPLPCKRKTNRPTSRQILGSLDAVMVVILPDGTRALSESVLFPEKMFRAVGVSLSAYLTIPRKTPNP